MPAQLTVGRYSYVGLVRPAVVLMMALINLRWLGARNAQLALSTPATGQCAKEALTRAAAFRQALGGVPRSYVVI